VLEAFRKNELQASPPQPEAAQTTQDPYGLQDVNGNCHHYYDVQNRFDTGSHWNETIDQPQAYAYDDQNNYEID
jgi:hypothetical protein